MEIYEQKNGKQAIWQGKITKGFLRWKEGEKDYYTDKKRISVYVSSEIEKKWEKFMKTHNYSSFSKLIRESVNYYINEKIKFGRKILTKLETESDLDLVHLLKEKLTTIKGFSQLLLEKYSNDFNEEIKSIVNNVLNEIKSLSCDLDSISAFISYILIDFWN